MKKYMCLVFLFCGIYSQTIIIEGTKAIFIEPNFGSGILGYTNERDQFELLSKEGNEWNTWYKISNKRVTGFVYNPSIEYVKTNYSKSDNSSIKPGKWKRSNTSLSSISDQNHYLISGNSGTRYDGVIIGGTKESGWGVFTVKTHASSDGRDRFGNRYEGEFLGNKINGRGTFTIINGEKYIGEFKDGKYHGRGTGTFANGDKYIGEHKEGNRNGKGTYYFANGDKYYGEWKDGKWHGQGIYVHTNGFQYEGEWKDDNCPKRKKNKVKKNYIAETKLKV